MFALVESSSRFDYKRCSLRRVQRGLVLVYASICSTLLCFIILPLIALALVVAAPRGTETRYLVDMLLLASIVPLFFALPSFAGKVMCAAVPVELGGKRFAIAALKLEAASWILKYASNSFEDENTALVFRLLSLVTFVGSVSCFICFMSAVS